jgi:protein gp37
MQTELTVSKEQEGMQLLDEVKQIGRQAIYECGKRFIQIREKKLYPMGDKFISFCIKNCDFEKAQIYRSIDAAKHIDLLAISHETPERILRPLKQLPTEKAKISVWTEISDNGNTPTTERVEKAVTHWIMTQGHVKTKKGKPTKIAFNPTSEKVDWAVWTWNPVFGCKHGCQYCYAAEFAKRQNRNFTKPDLIMHQLAAPKNSGIPKGKEDMPGIHNVFVCSMADLFGEWVPDDWIQKVFNACRDNPQWTYIFLTKNPERLSDFEWADNWWVGTTVDDQSRVDRAEKAFKDVQAKVKFVSLEPFNERITFNHLEYFNWVIIGGQSKTSKIKAFQPESRWVERVVYQARKADCQIYFKPNLEYAPKEYPI